MSDLSFLRMSSDRGCSGGRKIAHQPSGGRLSAAGHETVLADHQNQSLILRADCPNRRIQTANPTHTHSL